MSQVIRKVIPQDLPALKSVLDSSGLFPSDMLDDMISDFFGNDESSDYWFTTTENDNPVSLGYCAPEQMTEGTFNLYAIAVNKEHQGKGIGTEMMTYIENHLRQNDERILIVETSGALEFELTHAFYRKNGYKEQAVIPEFYAEGEDKVVFWKKLNDQ